jgi:hypothetical protein
MSDDTSMSIEAMRKELEANGYDPVVTGGGVIREYLLSTGTFEETWQHYQREKQRKAMRELLIGILDCIEATGEQEKAMIETAKALLDSLPEKGE